ncbi:RNA exonuclease 4 isoform X1 [Vitis riparia]|uniref:RNA exonuclease 4 isoform X1 n=1 Tax=Vitis riparia TaxID=96939 RepID=UPI00155A65B8|nr:RNA exonuclease 4 isoform X1 [Vitis riparia]
MGSEAVPSESRTTRYKCLACFRQYKKKEHLVEHMRVSYHSVHQPKCGVCQKQFKSFQSLREHLTGNLPKKNCLKIFSEQGCNYCLKIFKNADSLSEHKEMCQLPVPVTIEKIRMPSTESQIDFSDSINRDYTSRCLEAIAIDCEKVGGGSDGSLDLCARVCLIDEDENIIFHTYVQPQIPVTNYRYELTGITEAHLRDAMPLKDVREKVMEVLRNGESIGRLRLDGGKGRLLVGHDLRHDLDCLRMHYPDHLLRDTAKYLPLMKTNLVSFSLKSLTQKYLGYDIQSGMHDPYEDCVSVMRLYKRMRSQDHSDEGIGTAIVNHHTQSFGSGFDSWKLRELKNMTPDELYKLSRPNYRCWCLDSRQALQAESNDLWPQ